MFEHSILFRYTLNFASIGILVNYSNRILNTWYSNICKYSSIFQYSSLSKYSLMLVNIFIIRYIWIFLNIDYSDIRQNSNFAIIGILVNYSYRILINIIFEYLSIFINIRIFTTIKKFQISLLLEYWWIIRIVYVINILFKCFMIDYLIFEYLYIHQYLNIQHYTKY